MTSPMDLPLYGKVKLYETSKAELLDLWQTVLSKNNISVSENSKVDSIVKRRWDLQGNNSKGRSIYCGSCITCNRSERKSPKTEYPGGDEGKSGIPAART